MLIYIRGFVPSSCVRATNSESPTLENNTLHTSCNLVVIAILFLTRDSYSIAALYTSCIV
jgi:hypothetical protein